MNKHDVAVAIAARVGAQKGEVIKVIDALIDEVSCALKRGDDVVLVGFGSFYTKYRAERFGQNPKTGERLTVSASKSAGFRVGKKLKAELNIGREKQKKGVAN